MPITRHRRAPRTARCVALLLAMAIVGLTPSPSTLAMRGSQPTAQTPPSAPRRAIGRTAPDTLTQIPPSPRRQLLNGGPLVTVAGDSEINKCETKSYTISIQNNTGSPLTAITVTAKIENLTGFSCVADNSHPACLLAWPRREK